MSDNSLYCTDCAMFLSGGEKYTLVLLLTRHKWVAKTVHKNQILNLGDQHHKDT